MSETNPIEQFEPEESRSWDEQNINEENPKTEQPQNQTIPPELYYTINEGMDPETGIEIEPNAEKLYYEARAKRIMKIADQLTEQGQQIAKIEDNNENVRRLFGDELHDTYVATILAFNNMISHDLTQKNNNSTSENLRLDGDFNNDIFRHVNHFFDFGRITGDKELMIAMKELILKQTEKTE